MKFHNTIDELTAVVENLGISGGWTHDEAAKKHCFRAKSGEVLNWYTGTGTLQ